ncbi:MAG: hypothetical protein QOJ46_336 [bacterium]|jgi:hypothetical protein
MSDVDDLLREFRADVPEPAEGAEERILERARRAQPQPQPAVAVAPQPSPAQPRRRSLAHPRRRSLAHARLRSLAQPRRRSPRWRWVLLPVAAATAVSLVVALAPSRDATNGVPTLLERAEAAISSPNRIIELSTTIRSVFSGSGAVNPHRTIKMRQWTLAGEGRATQFRILISEGPLDKPPTDEDSTTMTDRTGHVIDTRSWTPLFVRARDNYDYPNGGGRGQLEIGLPRGILQGPLTLVDRLRDAYRSGHLKPIGRTASGDLRFRLDLGSTGCARWEFVLDAHTLLPRRFVSTEGSKPCGAGKPTSREVWTIGEARSLPATTSNRRLLAIGDWPTARTVQERPHGASKPIDRVPPVPKLDER